eukprot:4710726-Pleurochrysis_carterae.AAC.3
MLHSLSNYRYPTSKLTFNFGMTARAGTGLGHLKENVDWPVLRAVAVTSAAVLLSMHNGSARRIKVISGTCIIVAWDSRIDVQPVIIGYGTSHVRQYTRHSRRDMDDR